MVDTVMLRQIREMLYKYEYALSYEDCNEIMAIFSKAIERNKKKLAKSSEKVNFNPCPFCGSTDIGVKDIIIDLYPDTSDGAKTRRKIWAYCRCCGTEGKKFTTVVDDSTDEETEVAAELWNRRDGQFCNEI